MDPRTPEALVNNAVYDTLGERWYGAFDDPVALLRAESRLRNPWIAGVIRDRLRTGPKSAGATRVLDVGCGGGFLSNYLAVGGYDVTGIDQSTASLAIAAQHDETGRVRYQAADAARLPFPDQTFDVVCAMDFLEHVEDPAAIIAEAARVLRPGGLFFFHTFNRNPVAWLVIIKLVEWLIRNTPEHLHVLRLFIKPRELAAACAAAGLHVVELRGTRPKLCSWSVLRGLLRRSVAPDFAFAFTASTLIAYSGFAAKPAGPA